MELGKLILEYVKALVWPLTVFSLCLTFRSEIKKILAKVKKAAFPGGISVDFQEEVQQVKELSKEVEAAPPPSDRKQAKNILAKDANQRMIALGLTPVSSGLDLTYHRNIAETDPLLALAGLRIELETLTRNLAKGFKIQTRPTETVRNLLIRLENAGAITASQMQLAVRILGVCNRAIHGEPVSQQEAGNVIEAADVVYKDYLAWLSWGFPDK